MKNPITLLPTAIRKHLVIRTGLGIVFAILFVVLLACVRDIILSLPCIVFAAFLLGSAFSLMHAQRAGNVLCVRGNCVKLEKGLFHLRNKAVYLDSEHGTIKVVAFKTLKKIAIGDLLDLYIKKSSHVYERGGEFTVSDYIALVKADAH